MRYVITTEPGGRGVGKDVDGKSHTWQFHPSVLAVTLDSSMDTPLGTERGRSWLVSQRQWRSYIVRSVAP